MVGSSWKMADTSGVAPMTSPADTKRVFRGLVDSRSRTYWARYSAPPAGVAPMRPPELVESGGRS